MPGCNHTIVLSKEIPFASVRGIGLEGGGHKGVRHKSGGHANMRH